MSYVVKPKKELGKQLALPLTVVVMLNFRYGYVKKADMLMLQLIKKIFDISERSDIR